MKDGLKYSVKLMENSISYEELKAIKECLESGYYTQGDIVEKFEKKFAEWNGSKYAVMVSSGSAATLLMVDYAKTKYNLKEGDEILVPNVTWPTTIYPVIQRGLSPVFCDVDESYNIDINSMEKMLSQKTKGVIGVHLLGQPIKLKEIQEFCDKNNLFLLEDCCESLGAKYQGKKVGNFGDMGAYSFYFGHHMTTIEGGMITTNDFETYDQLKSLRFHGMVRGTNRENKYKEFKNNGFVFDSLGYNLKNTNIHASIGLAQLEKIDSFIETRIKNHKYFLEKIKELPIKSQKVDLNQTSSFSLGIIFENENIRETMLENLPKWGIECRPIVAGNLLKQPVFKNANYRKDSETFADEIHHKGIYLPNNQFLNKEKIDYMINTMKRIMDSSQTSSEIAYEDLPKLREKFKDKKIVFCSGSFDLIHAGHVLFLEDCKKQGDLLFVSVGSDNLLKKIKGNSRPIFNEKVRMKMISSMKPVDYCFLDDVLKENDPKNGLKLAFEKLKPNEYIVNDDATNLEYRKELCEKFGIKMKVLPRVCPKEYNNISTSKIIEKIKFS